MRRASRTRVTVEMPSIRQKRKAPFCGLCDASAPLAGADKSEHADCRFHAELYAHEWLRDSRIFMRHCDTSIYVFALCAMPWQKRAPPRRAALLFMRHILLPCFDVCATRVRLMFARYMLILRAIFRA